MTMKRRLWQYAMLMMTLTFAAKEDTVPNNDPRLKAKPLLRPDLSGRFEWSGWVGERIKANQENWLLQAPVANPAMLQMFRDRDRQPRRALVPWAGEFAGKYLISAVQGYRLTRDKRLRSLLEGFVRDLIAVQDADGYLGPHPQSQRLTGKTHDGNHALWDLWGHYHCMLGLLMWWQETGNAAALSAACKSADLMCQRFFDTGIRPIHAGAEEMNLAVSHAFCLLYEATGNERYLRMVREIERDWETPPAGDYVRTALKGMEFFQTPKPRWESLPDVQAIAELYFITGDEKYRKAATHIWDSIKRLDRHNTGGFSSAEQAVGNPYDGRAIETCCVIAWQALSQDVLRMTGDSMVADEMELSTFNSIMGAQHPSGRWWTYNTPMDGVRRASAHDIVFQAHQGAPELNCCSVNAPRGIGSLSEWAVMLTDDGIAVNFYAPCKVQLQNLTLTQTTDYPRDGKVDVKLTLAKPRQFSLRLRIPAWSRTTKVSVNGRGVKDVEAGKYLVINREWKNGDTIRLTFDMSLHHWIGQREQTNHVSLYRGPILLTYDQRFNTMDPDDVPPLDASNLSYTVDKSDNAPPPFLLLRFRAADGRTLRLCDFASAGAAGTPYRSWLPMSGVEKLLKEMESPFAVRLK